MCKPTYLKPVPINEIAKKWQDTTLDIKKLEAEHELMVKAYEENGVEVVLLDADPRMTNSVFARDFGGCIREGCIFGKFKESIRFFEGDQYRKKIEELGLPIVAECKEGLFEGGDFTFLDDNTLVIGMVARSNQKGVNEIQEQLDKIDQAKEDLKDPDKRDNALETISAAASAIDGLVANIQNIQSVIEEQNAIVEESVNNISGLISDSANKISEGVAELQQYIQKGTALGSESTRLTTQGGIDVPTGKAEVKAGEAINSNAISAVGSGGKGAKLIIDGNQRISAGGTRIQGGAKNLQSLTASIGKIGGDLSSLAEYTNSIGKIGEGVASLAEQYTNSIQPYIEATGTWDVDAIKEANTELQSQVKAFDGTQNTNNQNGQEFNYDSSKFRKAFGL